jgi:hypothetical protein
LKRHKRRSLHEGLWIILANHFDVGMRIGMLAVVLAAFVSFSGPAPPLGATRLELRISRHLDTIMRGPDSEEDQVLVLKVRDFRLNQRLQIPSDNVTAEFTATRFGPRSKGEAFNGYLIVKKIMPGKVEAAVHLDVTARTALGSYSQTAKFHGNYTFTQTADEGSTP